LWTARSAIGPLDLGSRIEFEAKRLPRAAIVACGAALATRPIPRTEKISASASARARRTPAAPSETLAGLVPTIGTPVRVDEQS